MSRARDIANLQSGGVINDASADLDFRIESGGNANMLFVDGGNDVLVIGQNAPDTTISGGKPAFQVIGSGFDGMAAVTRRDSGVYGPALILSKSKSTTPDNYSIVANGDTLGGITFIGDDGTNLDTYGATIQAVVDGTPGENDMPTRLVFSTTADGASSPTERMRIDTSGNVGIAMTPDSAVKLSVSGAIGPTNGSASAPTHTFYSDPDTGMFRTAANIIGFTAGGTETVQIGSFGVAADQLTNKTASGGIVIDAAGDITLDADGGDVIFKDGGSEKGRFTNNSGTFTIDANTNLTFRGGVQTFDNADGSVEYMRIDSNGNLGINGNPISYANGQATLFIEDTTNPAIAISDTGQSKDYFIVANGSRLGIVYGDGSNSSSASNITEIASFNNSGNVGIGTDSPQFKLHVNKGSSNYAPSNGVDENIVGFQTSYDSGGSQIVTFSNLDGNWVDGTSGADSAFGWLWGYQNLVRGGLIYDHRGTERMQMFSSYGTISFITPDSVDGDAVPTDSNMTERLVIAPGGDVSIGKTAVDTNAVGTDLYSYGLAVFVRNNGVVGLFNRLGGDGDVVSLRQASSEEGTISVSGSTVSYNGFSGLHESSGIASNIPVGTVCSTIDELDVYPDSQPDEKGSTEDHPKKGQTRADHAKIKVSDTEGDKRVYGVLQRYDNNDKPLVASVGIGSIRVTGACEGGDLLESNGDGTAKVQSDDIIRSKTIGKVTIGNSDTGVKLVSCVLYCG